MPTGNSHTTPTYHDRWLHTIAHFYITNLSVGAVHLCIFLFCFNRSGLTGDGGNVQCTRWRSNEFCRPRQSPKCHPLGTHGRTSIFHWNKSSRDLAALSAADTRQLPHLLYILTAIESTYTHYISLSVYVCVCARIEEWLLLAFKWNINWNHLQSNWMWFLLFASLLLIFYSCFEIDHLVPCSSLMFSSINQFFSHTPSLSAPCHVEFYFKCNFQFKELSMVCFFFFTSLVRYTVNSNKDTHTHTKSRHIKQSL